MNYNLPNKRALFLIILGFFYCSYNYALPIFKIEFLLGANNFPGNLGLYDPPVERLIKITNQSAVNMRQMLYITSNEFVIDTAL